MRKILCSTGALFPRTTPEKYIALGDMADKLNCDGFEFMVDSTMYENVHKLIQIVKPLKLWIPVVHCQKSLGESLCGMKAWFDETGYHEYRMTDEEDRTAFQNGIERFRVNLEIAGAFGADKMVLHLWNGIVSDKNLSKNIERFGVLNELARASRVELMIENVVCNHKNPLENIRRVHEAYRCATFVYDTKMSEFHNQTMELFSSEWDWLLRECLVSHMHINDYNGGYMDWSNLKTLPVGAGKIDFIGFFDKLAKYDYAGDFTVEAIAICRETGEVDYDMLNACFDRIRNLLRHTETHK